MVQEQTIMPNQNLGDGVGLDGRGPMKIPMRAQDQTIMAELKSL